MGHLLPCERQLGSQITSFHRIPSLQSSQYLHWTLEIIYIYSLYPDQEVHVKDYDHPEYEEEDPVTESKGHYHEEVEKTKIMYVFGHGWTPIIGLVFLLITYFTLDLASGKSRIKKGSSVTKMVSFSKRMMKSPNDKKNI